MFLQYIFQFRTAGVACSGNLCHRVSAIIHGTDDTDVVIGNTFLMVFSASFVGFSGHNEILALRMVAFETDRDIGFVYDHITLQLYFVIEQLDVLPGRWR